MRTARARRNRKKVRIHLDVDPVVFGVIRRAARLWRQNFRVFIRLAVEFRAADVLNSVPVVPLQGEELEAFNRIWELSREPGRLERVKAQSGEIDGPSDVERGRSRMSKSYPARLI